MSIVRVGCAIIRGGTTKGVYVDRSNLPVDPVARDSLILSLFGSPDNRQVNGLGGADPLTSKVAVIERGREPGVDIEYLSGEVGVDDAWINYSTMCGNLAAGAALYAVEYGMVEKVEPITQVRIRNGNTGKRLTASIPIVNGDYVMGRNEATDGVAGYGVQLSLAFHDPAGSITGVLLPTGLALDQLELGSQPFPCSIVDCGSLYGFFDARSLGLSGTESPRELDNDHALKDLVESLRVAIARRVSHTRPETCTTQQVKVAIVAADPRQEWNEAGQSVALMARVVNRYRTHKAYPVTGAICLSAAAAVQGSLVHRLVDNRGGLYTIRVTHPSGTITVRSSFEEQAGLCQIQETRVDRSARVLMCGSACAWTEEPADVRLESQRVAEELTEVP